MTFAPRAYLVKETMISIGINAVLSAVFVWLVFGGRDEVPVWGVGGLALDFLPQTFMISLMSVLVPSTITRKRRRAGTIGSCDPVLSFLPLNLFLRALCVAATAAILFSAAAALLLGAASAGPVAAAAIWPLKIGYGALVAVMVTPAALRVALGDAVAT